MRTTLRKILDKWREFNDSLITPSDFILVNAIMEHLDRNPCTSRELDKLLNINNEPKVGSILEELAKDNLIKKIDFCIDVDGHAIPSPLYFSLSYENKFLNAIIEKGMTIPDLYQELGCTDEFRIIAIIGTLARENKVQIDELPDGLKTICRKDGGLIHLVRHKKTKSVQAAQKE